MHLRLLFYVLLISLVIQACWPAKMVSKPSSAEPVKVEGGEVLGIMEQGLTVYKGIPFAAPPVGKLRWVSPQPVIPWNGILKADKFGPACPQMKITMPDYKIGKTSEDCLYLNVWTPAKITGEKLPVMVWIYGGGFSIGNTSTPTYNGAELSKQGVILVSVAYRVGPLGFLAHPELSANSPSNTSGNYGLLDQIAGLKWVKNNIEVFGGDPTNVTIFGESAGAISVSILAASPLAKGLFKRAISQSGGSFEPACKSDCGEDWMLTLKNAEEKGKWLAKKLGAKSINDLRKLSVDYLVAESGNKLGAYWPNLDGVVITNDLYTLYQKGQFNDVDILIGTNSDEGGVFVLPNNARNYTHQIKRRFGPFAHRILQLYPEGDAETNRRSLADIFGDTRFRWHTWTWANLQSKSSLNSIYVYYFDHVSIFSPLNFAMRLNGAAHGAELPYVFSNLTKEKLPEDLQMAKTMTAYWTNFAKNGNPNRAGLPYWPAYTTKQPTVMYLNKRPYVGTFPKEERLKVLDEYFEWLRNQ